MIFATQGEIMPFYYEKLIWAILFTVIVRISTISIFNEAYIDNSLLKITAIDSLIKALYYSQNTSGFFRSKSLIVRSEEARILK